MRFTRLAPGVLLAFLGGCVLAEYSAGSGDSGASTPNGHDDGGKKLGPDGGVLVGDDDDDDAGKPAGEAGTDGSVVVIPPFDAGPAVACGEQEGEILCEGFEGAFPPSGWTVQKAGGTQLAQGVGRTTAGAVLAKIPDSTTQTGAFITTAVNVFSEQLVVVTVDFVIDDPRAGGAFIRLELGQQLFELSVDAAGTIHGLTRTSTTATLPDKTLPGRPNVWRQFRAEYDLSAGTAKATVDGADCVSPVTAGTLPSSSGALALRLGAFANSTTDVGDQPDKTKAVWATIRLDDVLVTAQSTSGH